MGWKILFLFVIAIVIGFVLLGNGLCGNEELSRYISPDGKVDAVAFMRNCGATTSYSLHISIVPSGKRIRKRKTGNVYISDYCLTDYHWTSDSELIIERKERGEVFKSETSFRGYSVSY